MIGRRDSRTAAVGPPPASRSRSPKADNEEKLSTLIRTRELELRRNTDALEVMAKETGGFVIRNKNEFGLDRVFEDQNGYYLIGYRPESTTFDRRFHTYPNGHVQLDSMEIQYQAYKGQQRMRSRLV